MANANMHKAKKEKNDEFYTQLTDIEKEMKHYKEHFKGKVVFCNCDDPEWSNFWKYFELNFTHLGLKKLVATHFKQNEPSYKLEIIGDANDDGIVDYRDIVKTPLQQNGDFRSPEAIEILKEADIVVTNPPFSLFREYIAQLMEYEKKFLVIGSMPAVGYKDIFKLVKNNQIWLGVTAVKEFKQPDDTIKKFGNIYWFTNIEHNKRNEYLILVRSIVNTTYKNYDNFLAIEVSKVVDIPKDYMGLMGVPVSFLTKHNPEQFEICGFMNGGNKDMKIDGKFIYNRILIKRK